MKASNYWSENQIKKDIKKFNKNAVNYFENQHNSTISKNVRRALI